MIKKIIVYFTAPQATSSPIKRRRRGQFSAKIAKNKWTALEKNFTAVINKKQTISNIEKDMEVWLKVSHCVLEFFGNN